MLAIDMEMPKSCNYCDMCYKGRTCCITLLPVNIDSNERAGSCPLVEIEEHVDKLKQAHWIKVPGMNERCSNCNKYFPVSDFKDRPFEINYCPQCGAEMREE